MKQMDLSGGAQPQANTPLLDALAANVPGKLDALNKMVERLGGVIVVHLSHDVSYHDVLETLKSAGIKWYDAYPYVHKVPEGCDHIALMDIIAPYRLTDMAPHVYVVDRIELLYGNELWHRMCEAPGMVVMDHHGKTYEGPSVLHHDIVPREQWPDDMYNHGAYASAAAASSAHKPPAGIYTWLNGAYEIVNQRDLYRCDIVVRSIIVQLVYCAAQATMDLCDIHRECLGNREVQDAYARLVYKVSEFRNVLALKRACAPVVTTLVSDKFPYVTVRDAIDSIKSIASNAPVLEIPYLGELHFPMAGW